MTLGRIRSRVSPSVGGVGRAPVGTEGGVTLGRIRIRASPFSGRGGQGSRWYVGWSDLG